MKHTIYLMIFLFFASCHPTKQVNSLGTVENSSAHSGIATEERIAFVNFRIARDSVSNVNKVELIDVTYVSGHLKSNDGGVIRSNNYLTCILVEDLKSEDTVRIEHPLYRVYEYMNEKNEMSVKEVRNKEAKFFLRFQLKGKTAQIKIVETLNGSATRELTTVSL